MQEIDGLCRGSARSIDGYSIHEGLTACREHLVGYGGHAAAAGLSLDATQLGVFTDAITTHANAAIGREDLVPWLVIDADAALSEIDAGPVLELDRMAPFGRGNARPRFRIRDLRITEIKPMGRDNSHLSLRLAGDGGRGVRAVWWKQGERADALADGMRVDVVARANLNRWRCVPPNWRSSTWPRVVLITHARIHAACRSDAHRPVPAGLLPAAGDRAVAVTGLVEEEIVIAVDAAGVPWVSADTLDGLTRARDSCTGRTASSRWI